MGIGNTGVDAMREYIPEPRMSQMGSAFRGDLVGKATYLELEVPATRRAAH